MHINVVWERAIGYSSFLHDSFSAVFFIGFKLILKKNIWNIYSLQSLTLILTPTPQQDHHPLLILIHDPHTYDPPTQNVGLFLSTKLYGIPLSFCDLHKFIQEKTVGFYCFTWQLVLITYSTTEYGMFWRFLNSYTVWAVPGLFIS